ncbi:MAG: hypothetical protein CBB68_06530 [Rhodospirillaceae bacterium TMED8]|nr:hypothetical protein [Magnetovibrio sp.]OUT51272.1 MAG: hypothetical protein CBB68_06530 [Rhodospirillaceae bacterium TMED8]|tara:strand:- start:1833 stop:2741 length:909 start_codon:yes stop_codon:yes gene_type:complete
MAPKAIIHVGFYKTGTKTLQLNFFSKHPEINYLGAPYNNLAALKFINYIKNTEEASYLPSIAKELFKPVYEVFDNNTNILALSDEDLTSYEFVDRLTMVRRLNDILGGIKLLVSVRNQITQLESYYFQALKWYLRPGGVEIPFQNFIEDTLPMPRISPVHNLLYFNLLHSYEKLVGRDSLVILLYEDFRANNIREINNISSIMNLSSLEHDISANVSENARVSAQSVFYRKVRKVFLPKSRLSRLIPKFISHKFHSAINKGAPASITWEEGMRLRLEDFFREDNQKLASKFNLDLASHHYPL